MKCEILKSELSKLKHNMYTMRKIVDLSSYVSRLRTVRHLEAAHFNVNVCELLVPPSGDMSVMSHGRVTSTVSPAHDYISRTVVR